MPIAPTFPGVYIEEVPSGVRTIVGVATSLTAFLGRAKRGPTNKPITLENFGDFDRQFGGLDPNCPMSFAVQQFFLNGGVQAIIVRVANAATAKKALINAGGLNLEATGEGTWGNALRVRIDYKTKTIGNPSVDDLVFNIAIRDSDLKQTEVFRNVSVDRDSPRYIKTVLEEESQFVRIHGPDPDQRPSANGDLEKPTDDPFADDKEGTYFFPSAKDGVDGDPINDPDILGKEADKTGLYALEKADLFNILCIPPLSFQADLDPGTYGEAVAYCARRRAMLLVDPSTEVTTIDKAITAQGQLIDILTADKAKNAAFYFPRIKATNLLREGRLQEFVPCGAVAGVMARTDLQRGVWKSPAGLEAGLLGAREFSVRMTDPENGRLNPLGINCLRSFPVNGNVVWGARTMAGADRLASEWKYLAVRRMALFLEESLYRGTQWAVFEPNDEPLWAQLRLNIGAFMQDLFRKGAFQGRSPREAYFVNCGPETTRQNDINLGIVNVHVGFAPLKPAEFVIIQIQQIAGQIDT